MEGDQMNEIKNEYDALVTALALAISVPPGFEEKAKDMVEYAETLAAGFDAETVERAKAEAVAKAELEFSDEPLASA
jgi:hypothetical protein